VESRIKRRLGKGGGALSMPVGGTEVKHKRDKTSRGASYTKSGGGIRKKEEKKNSLLREGQGV